MVDIRRNPSSTQTANTGRYIALHLDGPFADPLTSGRFESNDREYRGCDGGTSPRSARQFGNGRQYYGDNQNDPQSTVSFARGGR